LVIEIRHGDDSGDWRNGRSDRRCRVSPAVKSQNMSKLFEAFANIFRIPDLRKRVLFTLGLLAVYRLGGHIPTPGINIIRWEEMFSRNSGGIFGFFDLFACGNIRRLTV